MNWSAKKWLGETGRGTWACSLHPGTPCLVRDLNLGLQVGAKIFYFCFFITQYEPLVTSTEDGNGGTEAGSWILQLLILFFGSF